MYLIFDGVEAAGKTTQAALLVERLEKEGYGIFTTKEPGSADPLCRQIRQLLLNPESKITPSAALCLFLADRCQHMEAVKAALKEGKVVISDRSSYSSFVYFMAALEEQDVADVAKQTAPLLDFAQKIRPDWCFVCSADFDWCRKRLSERGQLDRIEQLGERFHRRTHEFFKPGLLRHIQTEMSQAPVITKWLQPAHTTPKEQIHQEILNHILPVLEQV